MRTRNGQLPAQKRKGCRAISFAFENRLSYPKALIPEGTEEGARGMFVAGTSGHVMLG